MNEQMAMEMAIRARHQLSGMDATIRRIREMKASFAGMAGTIKASVRKIIAAVAKMKAAIVKLRNSFSTLRNTALKAFTAIVALNSIPIKFFADFEQKMAEVNTLLDVSEEKFQALGDGVIDLSNRMGESATSLSTGLYDIVSAGVAAEDSLGVLERSARAAAAGITDTQTAAGAGIATINAYNLEISELSNVFDLQFQTVKSGVITYRQLASAQGSMLPSARKLNESLENVYGSLAFITKNGLSADEASTSLARAFDGLATKASSLAEYGADVYDEFGKFRGILPIVEDLAVSLEGLSDEAMQDSLIDIGFDIRAARAIIPMIGNIDGLRETIEAMNESSGAMEGAFEKATNTIQFRFNRAKESIINAVREMGSAWQTEINDILDRVAAWAQALQTFVSDNKEAIKSIVTFALQLAATVAIIGAVGAAIFTLMTPMGMVTAGLAILAGAWYLNLWDIRGVTANVVDYVLEKWDQLKDWWQNTTWLEKAQDIGYLALNIAGFVWNTAVDIYESLKNWIFEKIDKDGDGVISFDEAVEFALDIALVLGAVTAAITGAKLVKAIAAAITATGLLAWKIGGALALGMSIGATLSVLLDPQVESFGDWKEQFAEGLEYYLSGDFWSDVFYILEVEWDLFWQNRVEKTKDIFGDLFSKDFWLDVWDGMKEAWNETWKEMLTPNVDTSKIRQGFEEVWVNPWANMYDGGNRTTWTDRLRGVFGFASGGYISGPGTATSDSIPAMLSNGEYVINAKATEKWLPFLEAINSGNIPRFANGGHVSTNTAYLQAAGLQDNSALAYLAEIAHDTDNFAHIVDLIAGIQNMRQEYQELMAGLQKEADEAVKKLEGIENNTGDTLPEDATWKDIIKAAINDSELLNQMSSFFSNLEGLTGNSGLGLIGQLIGHGQQGYQQFQAFGQATDILGQLTAGFGMANMAMAAVGAIQSWQESRNQEAIQQWEEQKRLGEEQLQNIKAIEENTRNTARDIVRVLAQNPTRSRVGAAEGLHDTTIDLIRNELIPQFSDISIRADGKGLFLSSTTTMTEDPLRMLRELGYGDQLSGMGNNISNLGFDQLSELNNLVQSISASEFEKIAKDMADSGGLFGMSHNLKNFDTNWETFQNQLDTYVQTVKELEAALDNIAQNVRYESFAGVEWLTAQEQVESYRNQIEELYIAAGKNLNEHSDEIDAIVEQYAEAMVDGGERIITIMQSVRQSFIEVFRSGEDAAESFAAGLRVYFDTIKQNIASLFYDIHMDELDAQFHEVFGGIVDELANYEGNDVLGFAEMLLQGNDIQQLFASVIDMQGTLGNMESINDILIEQFTEQAKAAGMTASEIDEMLELMGLVNEEARRMAQNIGSALQSAMRSALDTGELIDFHRSLGESIYQSARDGLIRAFMESEVYQQMFESWFDMDNIQFTGDLEADLGMIEDILAGLEDELREAGMDFRATVVETAQNGAGGSGGLYDSDNYFVPDAGEGGATVVEKHYHYSPKINKLYGKTDKELFEEWLEWRKDLEDDEV